MKYDIPKRCQRMVREYEKLGYGLVPTNRIGLLMMQFAIQNNPPPDFFPNVQVVYIAAYTNEGKAHPHAGVAMVNRSKGSLPRKAHITEMGTFN